MFRILQLSGNGQKYDKPLGPVLLCAGIVSGIGLKIKFFVPNY